MRLCRRHRCAGWARHQRALDPRAAVAGPARVQRRRAAPVAHAGRPGAPRALNRVCHLSSGRASAHSTAPSGGCGACRPPWCAQGFEQGLQSKQWPGQRAFNGAKWRMWRMPPALVRPGL